MDTSSLSDGPHPRTLLFRKVENHWTPEILSQQRGWFLLWDVTRKLKLGHGFSYRHLLLKRNRLLRVKLDPARIMGIQSLGGRLWIHMETFNRWYREAVTHWVNRPGQRLELDLREAAPPLLPWRQPTRRGSS